MVQAGSLMEPLYQLLLQLSHNMKGAQALICPTCGGFYTHIFKERRLGKDIKTKLCACGGKQVDTVDGMVSTSFVYDDHGNVLHKEKRVNESNTKESR